MEQSALVTMSLHRSLAGFPHRLNLVTSCDEVADGRQGGTGLRRRQDDRTKIYPFDGTDTADFADGGRGENRPHACGGTVLFEERRAGKPLCHDGERRSNLWSSPSAVKSAHTELSSFR